MSGMWDNYLIAQALGLPWNGWTMFGITAIEFLIVFALLIIGLYIKQKQMRRWKL